ncbi:DUF6440 family protein [Marinococcus luteus]|uniref:DUF6440 family protein n=1 Tax=Marinococcus luteus TaxID=1122204 RepID=UPI002ACC5019|nr:DUF6440 family protein [Marinococcus luteus]MDZ5781966.1 DUF6440 family protein [Marinococcus luteus]
MIRLFKRNEEGKEQRFYIKQSESLSKLGEVFIIVDRKTGINYMCTVAGTGSSLTPLLDSEGNPVRE